MQLFAFFLAARCRGPLDGQRPAFLLRQVAQHLPVFRPAAHQCLAQRAQEGKPRRKRRPAGHLQAQPVQRHLGVAVLQQPVADGPCDFGGGVRVLGVNGRLKRSRLHVGQLGALLVDQRFHAWTIQPSPTHTSPTVAAASS